MSMSDSSFRGFPVHYTISGPLRPVLLDEHSAGADGVPDLPVLHAGDMDACSVASGTRRDVGVRHHGDELREPPQLRPTRIIQPLLPVAMPPHELVDDAPRHRGGAKLVSDAAGLVVNIPPRTAFRRADRADEAVGAAPVQLPAVLLRRHRVRVEVVEICGGVTGAGAGAALRCFRL